MSRTLSPPLLNRSIDYWASIVTGRPTEKRGAKMGANRMSRFVLNHAVWGR
jgi:hypothetical protein